MNETISLAALRFDKLEIALGDSNEIIIISEPW
jgi:hypothetical protein